MTETTVDRLDALAVTDFLATQEMGVLAMADDDAGYGIPLSFAFDEADHALYFRLGYGPESRKRRFVEASETVSFVVCDRTERGWTSVVARGGLEVVAESSVDAALLEATRELDIPYVRVHDQPASEMSFEVARLTVTDLSGIAEG